MQILKINLRIINKERKILSWKMNDKIRSR